MKQFAIFITTNMKNQVACKQPIKHQQLTTYSNAVWVLHQSHIMMRHLVNRLAAILHQIPINFSVTFCHSVFNMSLKLLLIVLKVPDCWIFTNTCTKEQQQTMRWQKTQTQRYSVHYACSQSQRQQWWHSIHRQRTTNVQVRGQCEMVRACCWRQRWFHRTTTQATLVPDHRPHRRPSSWQQLSLRSSANSDLQTCTPRRSMRTAEATCTWHSWQCLPSPPVMPLAPPQSSCDGTQLILPDKQTTCQCFWVQQYHCTECLLINGSGCVLARQTHTLHHHCIILIHAAVISMLA